MTNNEWMSLAVNASSLSSCVRRHVGACIVKDGRLLSIGFNHTPNGIEQCTEDTCVRKVNNIPSGTRHEMCLAVHAEQNAIINAFKRKCDLEGATLYVNDSPCVICSRFLINSGIKKVYYGNEYPDSFSFEVLSRAGVETEKIDLSNADIKSTEELFNSIVSMDQKLDSTDNSKSNYVADSGIIMLNDIDDLDTKILSKINDVNDNHALILVDSVKEEVLKAVLETTKETMYQNGSFQPVIVVGIKIKNGYIPNHVALSRMAERLELNPNLLISVDDLSRNKSSFVTIYMLKESSIDDDYAKTEDSVEINHQRELVLDDLIGKPQINYDDNTEKKDQIKHALELSFSKYKKYTR